MLRAYDPLGNPTPNYDRLRLAERPAKAIMIEARLAKFLMVGSLAVLALLVTFSNLTDDNSDFQFVSHDLSMDTTHPGNELLHRQVTIPVIWTAACALVILGEGLPGAGRRASLGVTRN